MTEFCPQDHGRATDAIVMGTIARLRRPLAVMVTVCILGILSMYSETLNFIKLSQPLLATKPPKVELIDTEIEWIGGNPGFQDDPLGLKSYGWLKSQTVPNRCKLIVRFGRATVIANSLSGTHTAN